MSKKDGTLFSSALFGYKKSDVNEYIKRSDISHSDQLSLLQSENNRLLERAKIAEARVQELEKRLGEMEHSSKEQIERVTREYENKLRAASEDSKPKGLAGFSFKNRKGLFGKKK